MDESYDLYEEISDFLGGTFHQDMGSPEKAISEFISEATKECIRSTINYIEGFLNTSELTREEKNDFIESNAEIYFPAIRLTPIQWLESVAEQLKGAVANK